jgi:hypothetical protein
MEIVEPKGRCFGCGWPIPADLEFDEWGILWHGCLGTNDWYWYPECDPVEGGGRSLTRREHHKVYEGV